MLLMRLEEYRDRFGPYPVDALPKSLAPMRSALSPHADAGLVVFPLAPEAAK